MIKLENTEVVGWEPTIRGMRNPKNSWDRSDSDYRKILSKKCDDCGKYELPDEESCDNCWINDTDCWLENVDQLDYIVGPNDHKLMMQLASGGPVHAKYRRMIVVYVDITAPLYWWKEFDTYKVGTVANSCSTMHKIHEKEFTLGDFSCEDLGIDIHAEWNDGEEVRLNLWEESFKAVVWNLELLRNRYNRETNPELKKKFWRAIIQYLPSSYNQKRTIMLNYEVLAGIYPMRKNHKLDEWHTFCEWIRCLPYSEIITG